MAERIRSFRLHLEFRASTHTMGDQNFEGKCQLRKRNLLSGRTEMAHITAPSK